MRNILSYQPGTKFTGEEIVKWANFQIENKTSHMKQGERILKRYKLKSTKEYYIRTSYEGIVYGEITNEVLVLK